MRSKLKNCAQTKTANYAATTIARLRVQMRRRVHSNARHLRVACLRAECCPTSASVEEAPARGGEVRWQFRPSTVDVDASLRRRRRRWRRHRTTSGDHDCLPSSRPPIVVGGGAIVVAAVSSGAYANVATERDRRWRSSPTPGSPTASPIAAVRSSSVEALRATS